MSKQIKPGMLCFLVNIPPNTAGHGHMGKVVTTTHMVGDEWAFKPPLPVNNPERFGGMLLVGLALPQFLSPIDGGPLGEDVYTTKHIPALDKHQPAFV